MPRCTEHRPVIETDLRLREEELEWGARQIQGAAIKPEEVGALRRVMVDSGQFFLEELGDVIARMMAKAVEDRGSAEQLSAALRRLLPKESAAPESSRMAIKKPAPLATRITDSASEPLVPDERHPIYLRADGFLAFLERWFIPGHVRMPPGEEGPIPERIAGLLRRPLVLGLALVMTAVFLYMFFWVNSLLRVE